MRSPQLRVLVLGAFVLTTWPAGASAQPLERVGTRALGMAGAFVAVADDASAVYWNPSGPATGSLFGFTIDYQWMREPRSDSFEPGVGPLSGSAPLIAIVTPPLGIGYHRLREFGRDVAAPDVPAIPEAVPVARLDVHHVGVTLLQTLIEGVTIGANVKYLHGSAATGIAIATTPEEVRDSAGDLDGRGSNAFDMDFGVKGGTDRWSVGLLVRNLLEPSFAAPSGRRLSLDRQLRAGMAVHATDRLLVAADVDLLEAASVAGRWRRAAIGVEHWWGDQVAVRGGFRFNTIGSARPVGSAGVSVALRSGLFAEAQGTLGADDGEEAVGASLRVAF